AATAFGVTGENDAPCASQLDGTSRLAQVWRAASRWGPLRLLGVLPSWPRRGFRARLRRVRNIVRLGRLVPAAATDDRQRARDQDQPEGGSHSGSVAAPRARSQRASGL